LDSIPKKDVEKLNMLVSETTENQRRLYKEKNKIKTIGDM